MSIAEWIDKREMGGFPAFSFQEVCSSFPSLSGAVVANELCRLGKQRRIQPVHKGFYIALPLRYRDRGVVPPYNYVDQLMRHLGKPYYISLLSAGVLHGAAHQRPQRLSVTTVAPRVSHSKSYNAHLTWCYRSEIPQELLCRTNSETGSIAYSNAELTAVDLVQYSQLIGGLSVAATVIEELLEKTDFRRWGERLAGCTTLPTLQRLGYILDVVLHAEEQALAVEELLSDGGKGELRYRPLATDTALDGAPRNTRWKILENKTISPDDL